MTAALGFLAALSLIVYFMWDLDRRREKLKGPASRLEQIASGNAKERMRSLRRLSVSAFSSGRIIDGLVREIEILERENGIELSKESCNPSLFFLKAKQIDRRLAALEHEA